MAAVDWFIRGATVGLCLLLATRLLFQDRSATAHLGALFVAGVAGYVLVSAPGVELIPPALRTIVHAAAIFNVVFFWWFARSLFEHKLQRQIYNWLPPLLLLLTLPFRAWHSSMNEAQWVSPVHQVVVVTLLLHIVYLSVRDYSGDLVEPRRHFRKMVATLVPLMMLAIVSVETGLFGITINNELLLLQAIALFMLVSSFAHWILQPRSELFTTAPLRGADAISLMHGHTKSHQPEVAPFDVDPTENAHERKKSSSAVDALEIERLCDLMDSGAYRKPGLTVGRLADELSMPEHRLRELINQQLGYRNFTAYLNDYRIAEAKSRLADPASTRVQIAQIAYDVGFNSIGPFNRAFRQATQQTPTEFRRQALANITAS